MNKIGITYHPKSEAARRVAEELRERLASRVGEVWLASAWDEEASRERVPGTDLLICCGGDGTVLRAARAVAPHPVTLLGVNMGRIGFLTEIGPTDLMGQIDAVLAGEGRIESRAMIEAESQRAADGAREQFRALNDIVVGRAGIGRTVQFSVDIDGTTAGDYRADGVIVATATGSTAYSLSVGGPILHPESREIVVTPVAPHLAPANSLILPADALVGITIAPAQRAMLSIDGGPDTELTGGDRVAVRRSEHVARFLRLGPPGEFFSRVGRRLNWLPE
jgi:NAD+ kinase